MNENEHDFIRDNIDLMLRVYEEYHPDGSISASNKCNLRSKMLSGKENVCYRLLISVCEQRLRKERQNTDKREIKRLEDINRERYRRIKEQDAIIKSQQETIKSQQKVCQDLTYRLLDRDD
tara:strand:+ start:300 stop:662 length:363 start_codon:yes stop_codon:yes gene_type:complete